MTTPLRERIQQEAELIQRFSGSYGRKFDDLISRLNGAIGSTDSTTPGQMSTNADGQCLRLCIEAVNMVLSMQGNLARVLDDLVREPRGPTV
ncbi:MAG: hypothetical protein M3O30_18195 [Planctomycetota bacterium]|nr:hypothetical protein [Planctomycetota bacterium]